MHGASGDMYYTSFELSNDGSKAALGGYCNDANICGPNNPNTLIALLDTSTISYIWKFFLPATSTYSQVQAVKWRLDNTKLLFVLKTSGYPFILL